MSKLTHYLYLFILSLVATLIYLYFFQEYFMGVSWVAIIFWGILAVVSETYNFELPSGAATSVGMAIYIAALMTDGPLAAVTVAIVAFVFRCPKVEGKRMTIFKSRPSVTIFNIASHVTFIGVISFIYDQVISVTSSFAVKVIVSLCLLTVSELLSILFVSLYLYTKNGKRNIPLLKSFLGALPSTWAVGALGLILAYFASNENGMPIVGVFFIPLLLTRYSFKLYFDSQNMSMETIHALNETLHVRDYYTSSHTERVEEYSIMMGEALKYSKSSLDRLRKAARLHDIGKIGTPDGILNKPGALTKDEYEIIKDHPAIGAQILGNVDSLKKIAEIVRYHHERPDGKGYPNGLRGEEIPQESAILSIADTYDAMTSDRPYRKALSKKDAVEELEKYSGTQFNQELVKVFVESIDAHEDRKQAQLFGLNSVGTKI